MGSKDLKDAIDRHLFVPLGDELAEQLNEISSSMMKDYNIFVFENYVRDFFEGNVSRSFMRSFNLAFEKKYGEMLYLPSIVYVILEFYLVFLVIQSVNEEASTKLKLSYVVKNYAVMRKMSGKEVLCPDWVLKIYYFNERNKTKPVTHVSYSQLLDSVTPFNSWEKTGIDVNNDEIFHQLRSLCIAGYRGKLNEFVSRQSFKELNSPFAQVYLLVSKMVKEWHWEYVAASPVRVILDYFGEKAKKRKKLSKIVDEVLENISTTDMVKPSMKSSILLSGLAGGKSSCLDNSMFTVMEFGVYLYNELLLEYFNN